MANRYNRTRLILAKPKVCKKPPQPPPQPPGPIGCSGITGLWNTGEEYTSDGTNDVDDHWQATSGPIIAWSGYPSGWVDPPTNTLWIGPIGWQSKPKTYEEEYTLLFNVDENVEPSLITIGGVFACDNRLIDCQVNGVIQDITCWYTWPPGYPRYFCHENLTPYQIDSNDLVSGTNSIRWRVDNLPEYWGNSPTGFLCTVGCTD